MVIESFIRCNTSAKQNKNHSEVYMKTPKKTAASHQTVFYQLRANSAKDAIVSAAGLEQSIKQQKKIFKDVKLWLLNSSMVCG